MSAEATHKRRRSTRDPEPATEENTAHQREQDLRRARGEISCAECHRLKLRCDRKIPCSACIRRGRPGLCPNGISNGPAARFPLADTEMYRKLCEMSERIRQLEEALEGFQTTHPLLKKDLLDVKSVSGASCSPEGEAPHDEKIVDAFGTLAISDRGETRFLGWQGGAESILLASDGSPLDYSNGNGDASLHPLITRMSLSFPYTPPNISSTDMIDLIVSHLPSVERATSLCETYLEHCSWLMRPVDRQQLFNELIPTIYRRKTPTPRSDGSSNAASPSVTASSGSDSEIFPDELALLIMVFAVGALTDLTQPPYNDEAESYYHLGRTALGLAEIFEQPSLAVVQGVALMAGYMSLSGRRYTLDAACLTIKMAASIAKCTGLHRDPGKWGLDKKTANRRRMVFWDIQTGDGMICQVVGAAPSVNMSQWDCEYPEDEEKVTLPDGTVEPGFWATRYDYTRNIVHHINALSAEAEPVSYSEVLALDRKIREFKIPSHLLATEDPKDWQSEGPRIVMCRYMTTIVRDISMVILHRAYFAKALLEHPVNPLRSRYFHSFLTAYRSSLAVLKVMRVCYEHYPNLTTRYWSMWTHAFAAIMILGSVVIRGPISNLAPAALTEVGLSVQMFELADLQSVRGKRVMPILRRIREKAYQAFNKARSNRPPAIARLDQLSTSEPEPEDDDWSDELAVLGGKTRVIATKEIPRPRPPSRHSPSGVTPPPSMSTPTSSTLESFWPDTSLSAFGSNHFGSGSAMPNGGNGMNLTAQQMYFDPSLPSLEDMFKAAYQSSQSPSNLPNQQLFDMSQQQPPQQPPITPQQHSPPSANFFGYPAQDLGQQQQHAQQQQQQHQQQQHQQQQHQQQQQQQMPPLSFAQMSMFSQQPSSDPFGFLGQPQQMQQLPQQPQPQQHPSPAAQGTNKSSPFSGQTAEQAWVSLVQDSGCVDDEWSFFYGQPKID